MGQIRVTSACGSLAAVLQADFQTSLQKAPDPLDQQQQTIEMIIAPYLIECSDSDKTPDILEATNFLMQRINDDVLTIVQDLNSRFNGQIALITGMTINTELGNFFSPSLVKILDS